MKSFVKTTVGLIVMIVALLGILDAGYITWNDVRGIVPPCHPPFACNEVLKSPWAHVGPLPLAAIGMLYYGVVFLLAILHIGELPVIRLSSKLKFRPSELLVTFTSAGILFSAYLVSIMAFAIKAWCLYCLFSATFSFMLFVCSFFLHKHKRTHAPIDLPAFRRRIFGIFYQWVAKPFFFLFDAEVVHTRMTNTGKMLGQFGLTRALTSFVFEFNDPKLNRTIDGIHFPNPVGLSAGFDYNADLPFILPSVGFGFATLGTITLEPYAGNAKPRLGRYPRSKALLVNKGFKNIGARAVIQKLKNKEFAIPIGISIGSTNKKHASLSAQIADILASFELFEKSKCQHSYYELNISCPNTTGGQPFTTAERLEKLLSKLEKLKIKKPIYIKMPIDLPDRETLSLLKTAQPHTIAGVIFGNLTKDKTNPDVHPEDRKLWETAKGYLSGKPTQNRSNHCIALTKKHFKSRFTIIGTGGIFTPEDAALKLKLGANLVQLITGMIYEGPGLIGDINEHLVSLKK